jgi:glycosyltransferase involved in cell wall biosynthesis
MKIAFILPALKARGGARVVFEYANRLQRRGHEVVIAFIEGEATQRWFPLNVPVISRSELVKRASGIDILIATSWNTAPVCFALPAKAHVYFVQMFETLFYEDTRSQIDSYSTYRWDFDGFITISDWLQRMLSQEFQQESVVIPNGVNLDMFYPDPRFPKNDRVRVLIEGPPHYYKGVKDAFAAVAGLPVEVWSLSPQGPLGPVDRSFVSPSQDTIRQIYSSCDILLKTSWYEGRPCPHVEAMACGCAVVSSHMYGVDDLVDGQNALIVPPRDVAATRSALMRLIEDSALRERLIEGGLQTARKLDWEKSASQMEQALSDVLAKAAGHSVGQESQWPTPVHIALFDEAGKEQAQDALAALRQSMPQSTFSLSILGDNIQPDVAEYFTREGFSVLAIDSEQDNAAAWGQVVSQAGQRPIVLLSTLITIYNLDWIKYILGQLETDSQIGILGVKIVYPDGTIASAGGFVGPASKWALNHHVGHYGLHEQGYFYDQTCDVDWVDSRCVAIRAQVAHGLLDVPGKHPFGEDIVEYSLEAAKRGWRVVYFPQVMAGLEPVASVLEKLVFEDLPQVDFAERRMIARQKGLGHYIQVFAHDLREYGLAWVLKRSFRWLKWFVSKGS